MSLCVCIPSAVCKVGISRTMKLLLLFFLLIPLLIITTPAELLPVQASAAGEFQPVEPTEYRLIAATVRGRRLAPFQLCLLCKCCAAAAATTCATMPCCFGIDCQLPNKPYGVCAFVPKTCNCTSCAS
ncbi:hypothetical protein P3X46_008052 [Hevea brasiliensis]|uniref:DUF7866 domain-containing protein n=1 Tax=Hevea brasiliensis TaxID=3981 RepID=A0ABQ9MIG4_HEVBR|nr:hypothetical protein P3X46_008052 [Hevea brasiliensis]